MSDELERQGVKTNNKLWTATALINELDKVYQAHWDYTLLLELNWLLPIPIRLMYKCLLKQVIVSKKQKNLFGMQ